MTYLHSLAIGLLFLSLAAPPRARWMPALAGGIWIAIAAIGGIAELVRWLRDEERLRW